MFNPSLTSLLIESRVETLHRAGRNGRPSRSARARQGTTTAAGTRRTYITARSAR